MCTINENCIIENIAFAITFIRGGIHIKGLETSSENESNKVCKGPGHFGVEPKNIVSLDLSHCGLKDLPDCLTILPLKVLNVTGNALHKVPNCFLSGLQKLEELYIAHNKLKDFEVEPAFALRLRVLDLNNNHMLRLPIWILLVKSINLKELVYSNNVLFSTSRSEYNKVASYHLEKILLRNSKVKDDNVMFLKSIRNLKHLDLSSGRFDCLRNSISCWNEFFTKPSWYDTLQVLNINYSYMMHLPELIAKIVNLKELYLKSCALYDLPKTIGNLQNLEVLDVSKNSLFQLPATFEKLEKLKILKLQINNLSQVTELYNLKNLEILDLYCNELESFNPDLYVEYIDLEDNYFDTSSLPEYMISHKSYRSKFDIRHRITGFKVQNTSVAHESDSSGGCDTYEDEDVVENCGTAKSNNVHVEDKESWDTSLQVKSHPDITSSDDEWDGLTTLFPLRGKKSNLSNNKLNLQGDEDKLYEDAN